MGETFPAKLIRVEARATRDLIDPALTALGGGPLALRRVEEEISASSENDSAHSDSSSYELSEPHFVGLARLATNEPLYSGQMARVKLHSTRAVNLWELAQGRFARWLKGFTARG
jgi:lipase chaperone LimK